MKHYTENKDNLLNRLSKIEGQVRGIQRMIKNDTYCVDVLTQIAAVKAAINNVGLIVLEGHTKGCVKNAINKDSGDEAIKELIDILKKFMK